MRKVTANKEKTKPGKGPKKDAVRESLTKELRELIPQLDSEGLAFLVEQARVHLYNMQVDKLNTAAEAANAASARAAGIKRSPGTSKAGDGKLRIEGTESGSSYYLYYRNANVMFSRDEMIRLGKIANAPGTDLEIRERLYNWFDRERKDIFALLPLANKFDDRLKALAALIKKSFRVREK